MTITIRLKAALPLAAAVFVFLVWLGRFAGADEIAQLGITEFVAWSVAVALIIAWSIILSIASLVDAIRR